MISNIAKRKTEGEGTSTLNNIKRVQRSVEGVKQLFQKEWRIFIYSGAIKIKLLTLQTSADAIVRFTNIKEDGDIEFHGKLLQKGSLWFMTNATGNIPAYLKFHIKNVNTKFTISTYNNFLEFFWVKLIWVPKQHLL